jgi:hypothetical protein
VLQARRNQALLALPLGQHHGDDLAASGDEFGQAQDGLVWQRPRLRLGGGDDASDHQGADRSGSGVLAEGLSKGADLGAVFHQHRPSGSGKAATATVSKPRFSPMKNVMSALGELR